MNPHGATVISIKKHVESTDIFELRHESFIENPKTYLRELCHLLSVELLKIISIIVQVLSANLRIKAVIMFNGVAN